MGKDDAGAFKQRCVANDRPQRKRPLRRIPVVTRHVEAIRISVDMRHPQSLSAGIGLGEATCEEVASRLQSGQPERLFGTLIAYEL